MPRQNLLFLTHRFPYPPNRGDRIRSYNLLRVLDQHFDISLGCTTDEPVSSEQKQHVQQFCKRVHVAELSKWPRRFRAVKALVGNQSLTEAMFNAPSLHQAITQWHAEQAFDQAVIFCSSMYPYLRNEHFKSTPAIVDLVDVDSEKWHQMSKEHSFPMSLIYAREAKTVRAIEKVIGHNAKLVTLVSDEEAKLYRDRCEPTSPVRGVSNGVDTTYFAPLPTETEVSPTATIQLVFTGVLDYSPNVEGMIWFCQKIMPKLRHHGDFRLKVVGRRPNSAVRNLDQIEGVEVVGEVPDVRPYLHSADIAISPLKLARGIQNKVLEAMACGLPTVVTPQSAEGIDASPGNEFWIANNLEDWVDTLCRLADSPALRDKTGTAARKLVESSYSWAAKLSKFIDAVQSTPRASKISSIESFETKSQE